MKHSTTNVLIYAIAILICLATTQAQEKIFQEKKWEYSYKDNNGLSFINAIIVPGDTSVLVTDDKLGTFELNLMTGKRIKDYTGKIKGGVAFSPDGKYLYTYNFEKVEWPSGKIASTLEQTKLYGIGDKLTINFHSNKLIVLSGNATSCNPNDWKRRIQVYDLKTMKFIDTIGVKNFGIDYLKLSDDGQYLVAKGTQFIKYEVTYTGLEAIIVDTIYLFDMHTYQLIAETDPRYKILPILYRSGTYSKDMKLLYYTGGGNLYLADGNTLEEKQKIKVLNCCLASSNTDLYLSSDNKYLAINAKQSNEIYILDLITEESLVKYSGLNASQIYILNNKQILTRSYSYITLLNTPLSDSSYVSIKEELIGIYPNPFKDNIIIPSSNFKQGNLTLSLYDAKGEKIIDLYNDNYNCEDELKFNLAPIPAGIYFITSFQNNITKTMKIVKE